jgi:hypothetical protein
MERVHDQSMSSPVLILMLALKFISSERFQFVDGRQHEGWHSPTEEPSCFATLVMAVIELVVNNVQKYR